MHRPLRRRLVPAAISLMTAIAACGPAKAPPVDSSRVGRVPAVDTSRRFTKAEFASLRWLDGKWRGAGANGKPFFEAYRGVNDTTLHWGKFSDSTFRTQIDSAVIGWHDGVVTDRGSGTPWIATHLDSTIASFTLAKAPMNRIVWAKTSADRWEAQVYTPDPLGHEQRVTYRMQRVKP